jgi:hypothetical protein
LRKLDLATLSGVLLRMPQQTKQKKIRNGPPNQLK